MKYLTRKEELVLLAICGIKENAYLVNIREYLNKNTDKKWSVGNVYVPLDRMAKLGYLELYIGPPTIKRGGKSVKYYRITRRGHDALLQIKTVNEKMWNGFEVVFEK